MDFDNVQFTQEIRDVEDIWSDYCDVIATLKLTKPSGFSLAFHFALCALIDHILAITVITPNLSIASTILSIMGKNVETPKEIECVLELKSLLKDVFLGHQLEPSILKEIIQNN